MSFNECDRANAHVDNSHTWEECGWFSPRPTVSLSKCTCRPGIPFCEYHITVMTRVAERQWEEMRLPHIELATGPMMYRAFGPLIRW